MKTFKNTSITALPAALGMPLKDFCQLFGLNYSAMRKAANGHQELSANQLSQWVQVNAKVQQMMQILEQSPPPIPAAMRQVDIEKKIAALAFEQTKLAHEMERVIEKITAVQKGRDVLHQCSVDSQTDQSERFAEQAKRMTARCEALEKRRNELSHNMYMTDCAYVYWQSLAQQCGQVSKHTTSKTKRKTNQSAQVGQRRSARLHGELSASGA